MGNLLIKQGVTFQLCCIFKNSSGAAVSLAGCTVSSQIRDPLSQLLATLSCVQPVGQQGVVNLYFSGSTRNWPAGRYFCDVLLTGADGVIRATQTFSVTVAPSITTSGSTPPDGVFNRLEVDVLDAGTLLGDASGSNVTSGGKTQTIGQWIAALSSGGTTPGGGIKSINVTQGTVIAGQSSTVTLTATLTDGSTTDPATFEVPAGASGEKGDTGATGPGGTAGAAGADGVGIASVAVTQDVVTAGQSSKVTLTATMTNGTTAPGVSFEAPAGAPGATGPQGAPGTAGSDANVTAATVNAALGYTAANGANYFPLLIDNNKDSSGKYNLPAIVATNSSFDDNGGLYTLGFADGPVIMVGLEKGFFGENFFTLTSMTSQPLGLILANQDGSAASLAAYKCPDGSGSTQSNAYNVDGRSGSGTIGAFLWTNQDDPEGRYWMLQAYTNTNGDFYPDLKLFAGTSNRSAWQKIPLIAFNGQNNQATLAVEPAILAYNAYTFAALPESPAAWQRTVVTDKAIGSGAQGVMAMWNPNLKAWTGLSGEALT